MCNYMIANQVLVHLLIVLSQPRIRKKLLDTWTCQPKGYLIDAITRELEWLVEDKPDRLLAVYRDAILLGDLPVDIPFRVDRTSI